MAKYCSECGESLPDKAKFCLECGAKIDATYGGAGLGIDVGKDVSGGIIAAARDVIVGNPQGEIVDCNVCRGMGLSETKKNVLIVMVRGLLVIVGVGEGYGGVKSVVEIEIGELSGDTKESEAVAQGRFPYPVLIATIRVKSESNLPAIIE